MGFGGGRGATRRAIVRSSSLLSIAAVACERGEGAPRPPAAISARLTVWGNPMFPFDEDVGGEIVSGLRAKYSGITVEFAPENDSLATKLIAASAGGAPPDLDSTSGFMAQTPGCKGLVLPLDGYMKRGRGIRRDDIWPSLLNEMTWRGSTYGLPYAPDLRQPITDLPTQILEKGVSIREALTQAQAAVQAALDLALRAA